MPNIYLQAGQDYTFSATLENFLGFRSTSAPYLVSVAAGAIPNLVITAGTHYNMLTPNQLSIFAKGSVAACPGQKAGGSLTYKWDCSLAGLVSTSVDPRFFKAVAFTFEPQTTYSISVVVEDQKG